MQMRILENLIQNGTLFLHYPDGATKTFGNGEPKAHIHLSEAGALKRVLRHPELSVGESYMEGDWWPGEGGLLAVFELYFANGGDLDDGFLLTWAKRLIGPVVKANNRIRSRRNVQHHYDIDTDLFHRFLDTDMQYSCAYFETPDLTLEQAQEAKCRHIARKLCLKPGDHVLDIGSGWGGMGLYLARHYDVDVTGLTLSNDQYEQSNSRAKKAGLSRRVRFLKEDYREHGEAHGEGDYDAIVSVGMFEHVGMPQYPTFFNHVARLLKPDGRSLIHSIGHTGVSERGGQEWIRKYIFPGGHIPSLSQAATPIERSDLVLSDLEIWRLHYAETLKNWNERFQAHRDEFSQRLGEAFCRMWEFYLIGCQAGFRWGELVVFHMQLAHRNDVVPITRDYLYQPNIDADDDKRQAS